MTAPAQQMTPEVSVVIPVYDEAPCLDALLSALQPVLRKLGDHEIVFVDDGSTDGSAEVILAAHVDDPRVKLVELSRNFGHPSALRAGLDHATGRAVVLMDADLQDPPELIEAFVERWHAGSDVVYGIRRARKEGPLLRASFHAFYRLAQRLSDTELPVDSGDFCLMDRRVVDAIRSLPDAGRYLRGQRAWVGFVQEGIAYERPARYRGDSKFSLAARVRFAADGLLAFSDAPLRLAPAVASVAAAVGGTAVLVAGAMAAAGARVDLALLAVALLTVQLAILAIIAAHLAHTRDIDRGRPRYVVKRCHGIASPAPPRSPAHPSG